MKILIYSHNFYPVVNGISKNCFSIAKHLSGQKHKVVIYAPRYNNMILFKDSGYPFKIIRTFKKTKSALMNIMLSLPFSFYAVLKFNPDLVFAPDLEALPVLAIATFPFTRKKLIAYLGGADILAYISSFKKENDLVSKVWRFIKSIIYLTILKKSKIIVTASKFIKNSISSKANIPRNNICILTPAVDKSVFSESNKIKVDELRKTLNLKDKKIILTVARLDPAKGQDKLIELLPKIKSSIQNVHYLIVGDGDYKKNLINFTVKQNVEELVTFTGYIPYETLPYYYDLCDVFIMLSRPHGNSEEGFGGTFLEAAYRGKPSIGGNCGGVQEAIIDNVTGFLVNPSNDTEITEKLIFLLNNDALIKKMGNCAKEMVKEDMFENQMYKIFS